MDPGIPEQRKLPVGWFSRVLQPSPKKGVKALLGDLVYKGHSISHFPASLAARETTPVAAYCQASACHCLGRSVGSWGPSG